MLNDRKYGGVARIEFTVDRATAAGIVQAIARLEAVSWIEEVPEVLPSSGTNGDLMQSGRLADTPFTDAGLHGQGATVGVLDKGRFDLSHCWFKDDGVAPGPTHRKIVAHHNLDPGTAIDRHSAFVAGILAGDDFNSPGTALERGIVWEARIAYGNTEDFRGSSASKSLLDYLNMLAADGAQIINNSWHANSATRYSRKAIDVDEFSWAHEDCLVVASSGNLTDTWGAPGIAKNALCVSASYVGPEGSCFGDGVVEAVPKGRRKPDLLGPGCGTRSAKAGTICDVVADIEIPATPPPPPPPAPCALQEVYCFTSFATPVVSAAAIIARQYFLDGRYSTGSPDSPPLTPSGALLKAVLINSTAKTTTSAGYPIHPEGWGLMQLDQALYLGIGERKLFVKDLRNADGLETDGAESFDIEVVSNKEPFRVTLAWTDPPCAANTTNPVVNNLDLEVTAPGGETYLGNAFDGEASAEADDPDTRQRDILNNVEMVLVNEPDPGHWTVTVKAKLVEPDKSPTGQGFALVVTGALA